MNNKKIFRGQFKNNIDERDSNRRGTKIECSIKKTALN